MRTGNEGNTLYRMIEHLDKLRKSNKEEVARKRCWFSSAAGAKHGVAYDNLRCEFNASLGMRLDLVMPIKIGTLTLMGGDGYVRSSY